MSTRSILVTARMAAVFALCLLALAIVRHRDPLRAALQALRRHPDPAPLPDIPLPASASWFAALRDCRRQPLTIDVLGTSRSIVDTTVSRPGSAASLSSTFAGRWVNQLAATLDAHCPSHGSGIVPLRWGTGPDSAQGMNADFFLPASSLQTTPETTDIGPHQGPDSMTLRFTFSSNETVRFLYPKPFDRLRMYCLQGPGLQPFTLLIDGHPSGHCGGPAQRLGPVLATSRPVRNGTHTAAFACPRAPCAGYALEALSGTVGLSINNLSVGGASAEIFAASPAQFAYKDLDPDPVALVLVEEGCNEPGRRATPATFQVSLQTIAAHYRERSPVPSMLLMADLQDALPGQAPFYAVLASSARTLHTAYLDLRLHQPSTVPSTALFGPDGVHESDLGNQAILSALVPMLLKPAQVR